jgi:hypothetical protein
MRLNPNFTGLKTLTITYRTPQETLLSTPQTLPTAEPASPQVRYTVTSADLPVMSIGVHRAIYTAALYAGGRFATAGTLYWRMRRNGVSVTTGSASVSANAYYTVNAGFFNINVGDVLEISLWSSVTDSQFDYSAFQVQVTRIIPLRRRRLLMPCNVTSVGNQPTLSLGAPSVATNYGYQIIHADALIVSFTDPRNLPAIYVGGTYGIYRIGLGDWQILNSAIVLTSATYRPYYTRDVVPTTIVFRGVSLD